MQLIAQHRPARCDMKILEDVDLQVVGSRYTHNRERYWRCSHVIYEGEEPYPKHIPAVRQAVERRGKIGGKVHEAIEVYLSGNRVRTAYLSNEELLLFKSWRDWFETVKTTAGFEVIAQELKVFHTPYLVAGRLDCLGRVNGKVDLCDWKTNPTLSRDMRTTYFAQLNGYNMMLEYLRNEEYVLRNCSIPKVDKLKLVHITPKRVKVHEAYPNEISFHKKYLGYLESEEMGMVVLPKWLPRNKLYRWPDGKVGRIYRRHKWGNLYYYLLHLL